MFTLPIGGRSLQESQRVKMRHIEKLRLKGIAICSPAASFPNKQLTGSLVGRDAAAESSCPSISEHKNSANADGI